MTLTDVREGLAQRLEGIGGLRVYATPPESLPQLPSAIIRPADQLAVYDQVMGGADVCYEFQVLVLVKSADEAQAWADLGTYISPTGPASVKAAVDGSLGGLADWGRVTRATGGGRVSYHRASYWGVTFHVEVYRSG